MLNQTTFALIGLLALCGTSTNAATPVRCLSVLTAVGGPPSIRLAKKASGDITSAEWNGVRDVDLAGCTPDARITKLTLCITDCKQQDASLSTTSKVLTKEMRAMIQNLPAGTKFTVKVEVKDGQGKDWKVPDASFTWKG